MRPQLLPGANTTIRTPLNSSWARHLLAATPLTQRSRFTRRAAQRCFAHHKRDLDFSKIEAGRMELEEQPYDLRGCIESAFDLVAARASEKGIDLAYSLDTNVPAFLISDSTRLRQILLNLLSNSLKFTESGEVVLSVTAARPAAGDLEPVELHFAVRDTGIGIPAERKDRLFRSFSQVDASTTRKYGGTGLGLVISKRLSELMGGTMGVESEGIPGKGSTLPLYHSSRPSASPVPDS